MSESVMLNKEKDTRESVMATDKEKDARESVMATDKEKDASESARCGRKLPLWLGLLLLLVAAGLLAPLIYFAVRANSEACLDGLRAQTECQGLNQHLQRQLHQAQEVLHEKEAEAATCEQTVVTLRGSLKKEQAQVAEFQGELKILNQKLKDALAEVERLRRQSETSRNNASSCSSFLFVVVAVLVLNAPLP
nr:bone marrow stromal antigen 2 isoform X2 [Odocoileus virginianus texanus]